jgi:hypothetical protein
MRTYKVSDILNDNQLSGSTEIVNFINQCKEHERSDKINSELRKHSRKIFCYEYNFHGVNYISFPLELIKKVLKLKDKSEISTTQTATFIKQVSGALSTDYTFFESNNFKFGKGDVALKQEIVCLAVSYFFNNPSKTIYNFHEYVKHLNRVIGKAELSFPLDDFKKFATMLNFKYVLDAVGVAKTLIANSSKLKLNNLKKYTVVEESHEKAKELKDYPFRRISKPPGYFANPDKLMIADIFLIDTTSKKHYQDNLKIFNMKTLSHEQYRKFMDNSFRNGAIVPISLKQLTPPTLSETLITSRVKIVGSYTREDQNDVDEDFIDEYMDAAIRLFSQKDMRAFVETMKKIIDIRISTTRFKTSGKNTEIDYITNFNLSGRHKKQYTIWMSGGSIYTKPKGTTSPAGMGGISSNFLVEEIIEKLPRSNQFFNKLNVARKQAFDVYYNELFEPREIITLEILNKFLNTKTKNEQVMFLSNYAKALKKNMAQNAPKLDLQGFRTLAVKDISQKMVHFEMMSYIIAHEQIVTEWIKKSFIMSMYGVASGTGKIIFDGKNIKQNNFGREGIKKHAILNPMYLKIGF